jgi:hypothetical protein
VRLAPAQQEEIVILLARGVGASKVKEHLRSHYGINVSIQAVLAYDASKPSFRNAERWRPIFEAARNSFLEDVGAVPIAHPAFRLNLLNDAALVARGRGNFALMAQLLEQAAREVGGMFTKVRAIDASEPRPHAELSAEEQIAAVARIFDKALGRTGLTGPPLEEIDF